MFLYGLMIGIGFVCGFLLAAVVARKTMRDKLRSLGIEPMRRRCTDHEWNPKN